MIKAAYSLSVLAALSMLALPMEAGAQRKSTADAALSMPWHEKTNPNRRFLFRAPYGDLASNRHLKANFEWYAVSEDLSEKSGAYNSYLLHIGITQDGLHEGIIYDKSIAGALNPGVAVNLLNKISGLTLFAEEGEGILIDLSDVKSATVPDSKDPEKMDTVHFRTFRFPQKAYRMMGALPEENRMRFFYRKPDGEVGYFGYHSRNHGDDPWAYSIGYAKELSQTALNKAR